MMATGSILAICQSGGEFVKQNDGTMSYIGGEAHAIDIDREMTLHDLETEMANMFKLKADSFSIKYLLPRNRRTLITVSSDKDVQRMVDYQANADTADVYVLKKVDDRIVPVAEPGAVSLSKKRKGSLTISTNEMCTNDMLDTPDESKRPKICDNDWDSLITCVGQVFDSAGAFRAALHKYAIANSFMYKFVKNEGSRVTAKCTDDECPWMIRASKKSSTQEFTIKKMRDLDDHNCDRKLTNEGHRLASQRWIASVIKDKLRESPNYKPREIADDLEREYGLSLNYSQAWRGKFVAKQELHNSREEACNQLPWYCDRIIETNPGSAATLVAPDGSSFRLFIAFNASLSGFEHGCRPLLFLDEVPLRANRHWKLLAATAVDGENDTFPVAFCIVEAGSNDNWNWFLAQLKSSMTISRTLTFISNGQDGLEEHVPGVFEHSHHGYCMRRLIEDFKSQFEESFTEDVKEALIDSLRRAVYACTVDEFNEAIDCIKLVSEELADWVSLSKPERWSDAFFKGLRHGHYSSNAVEMFKEWLPLKRYEPSVVQMVDMVRCKMMETIFTRRESSNPWSEILTPSTNRKLRDEIEKSHRLEVACSTESVFEVRDDTVYVVNIENWECLCRRWQVTGLPCRHALAVFEQMHSCVYDYCSKYFRTDCYRLSYLLPINPMPQCADICPRTRRGRGRPKSKPANPLAMMRIKRGVQCSRCLTYGHNKKTCKANIDMVSI